MDAQYLKSLLHYNPETGLFTWTQRKGNSRIGTLAGTLANGYIQIRIDGSCYLAHRLAWLYVTGTLPAFQIDHCDLNRSNNTWTNLREATCKQNHQNRTKTSRNKSGYLGVSLHKATGKFLACIKVDYVGHNLGLYNTAEEAYEAYKAAKRKFHKFNPVPVIRQGKSVESTVGNS